ncbi:hypothetical protein ACXJJ3_26685 [Kribbella sp. WER1]
MVMEPSFDVGPVDPAPVEYDVPRSEDRKQCPGHESIVGVVTHPVYPDDCLRDGFDTDPADEPYDPTLRR